MFRPPRWERESWLEGGRSVIVWGDNSVGQRDVPASTSGFVAVAAGNGHSLGLKGGGSIVAWAHNYYGQRTASAPNGGFVAIAGDTGACHSLGLKATRGDLSADGTLGAHDDQLLRAAFGHWRLDIAHRPMTDYDLDGCITLANHQTWLQRYRDGNAGLPTPPTLPVGDLNCDGVVAYANINPCVTLLALQ